MPLPPDYSTTGIFQEIGKELSILAFFRKIWGMCWKISTGGNTYLLDFLNTIYINSGAGTYTGQAQAEDAVESASKFSITNNVLGTVAAIHQQRKQDFEQYYLQDYLAWLLELGDETTGEGPIAFEYNQDLISDTGQVSISRRGGVWGSLARQMELDSKTIRGNGITLGALTARATNQGQLGEVSVGSSRGALLAGTLVIKCVDETVGRTQLQIEHRLTTRLIDGTEVVLADNVATVGDVAGSIGYEDGPICFSWSPKYAAILETGDDGNIVSNPVWSKPSDEDSNKGKAYIRVTRKNLIASGDPPSFLVEWYKDSNMTQENLVGSDGVEVITGTVAVTISGFVGTLGFDFNAANAATKCPTVDSFDNDIVLDLRVPREGDEWTKVITVTEDGLFLTKLSRTWPGVFLPNVADPGQNIDDTLANEISLVA